MKNVMRLLRVSKRTVDFSSLNLDSDITSGAREFAYVYKNMQEFLDKESEILMDADDENEVVGLAEMAIDDLQAIVKRLLNSMSIAEDMKKKVVNFKKEM